MEYWSVGVLGPERITNLLQSGSVLDAISIAELDKACFIARLSNDLARPGGERADEAAQAVRAHLRGFGVGAGF
jgi:hypothetical protein